MTWLTSARQRLGLDSLILAPKRQLRAEKLVPDQLHIAARNIINVHKYQMHWGGGGGAPEIELGVKHSIFGNFLPPTIQPMGLSTKCIGVAAGGTPKSSWASRPLEV